MVLSASSLSHRVSQIEDSITLALNAQATQLAEQGKKIYNLTAGQLPFRPPEDLVNCLEAQLRFLKSFMYAPAAGFPDLRQKFLKHFVETRGLQNSSYDVLSRWDSVISNGAKHSLWQIFYSLLNEGDEVILFRPYWVSYPPMIELCGAKVVALNSTIFDSFVPSLEDLERALGPKTKAIVLNSPNNPSGTHYPEDWMRGLGEILTKNPHVVLISDEIYFQLSYFDPKPSYVYQYFPELLKRTIIVDGISKTFASTGLRIGVTMANREFLDGVSKLQAQTSSGANSLVQRALVDFDFSQIDKFLEPIRSHLRINAQCIRETFRKRGLDHAWYQSSSAFYYLLDFSHCPVIDSFRSGNKESGKLEEAKIEDVSPLLCEKILHELGPALVPGGDFGMPNTARLSLVMDAGPFAEAIAVIADFLASRPS